MVDRGGRVIDRGAPVRIAALRALAEMEAERPASNGSEPPPSVVPGLAAALNDESPQVGRAAAEALGTVGSQPAVEELVDFLATRGRAAYPEVREAALEAVCGSGRSGLTELWCRKVVDAGRGMLDDVDRREFAVIMVADAADHPEQRLGRLLVPRLDSDGTGLDGPGPAEAILSWCMPTDLDELGPVLASQDVPLAAVRLAGLSGSQALLQPLVRLLEHDRKTVRREAVSALGALCDTGTVLPLLGATKDPDVTVRRRAVIALDSLGSAGVTAAMALLVQATGDRPGVTGSEPIPAMGGEKWTRTLDHLPERTGLLARAQRRLRGGDRPSSGSSEPAG